MDINKLRCACYNSWDEKTCYDGVLDRWNENNKELGHCAITSMVVNDYIGGNIIKAVVKDEEDAHYFNEVDENIIDLTIEQYNYSPIYELTKIKTKADLLKNENTKKRYEILSERVKLFLNKMDKVDKGVMNCNRCGSMVENFTHHTTIYYGRDTDILLVGEAPANNGWRKSGKCWYGDNGKITGTGRILEKLLNDINRNLEDISFVEAIKCFPPNRSNLKRCKDNCYDYLLDQIKILKPKVIVPLGDTATKSLLKDVKYKKFGEVVGVEHELNINDIKYKVIPIYHPSPISPVSYSGNVAIFEKIKEVSNEV
ncbi:MAG: hypothetical protein N4A47_01805 [Clostridia bacterium]|jgi:DNA polymerase|nr:hypothetical protein [Clostridia bacterium]